MPKKHAVQAYAILTLMLQEHSIIENQYLAAFRSCNQYPHNQNEKEIMINIAQRLNIQEHNAVKPVHMYIPFM